MRQKTGIFSFFLMLSGVISLLLAQEKLISALEIEGIKEIAKNTSVRIVGDRARGSGVIIKREGNTYTVLTAAHVFNSLWFDETPQKYSIFTSDGKSYLLKEDDIRPFPGIDLLLLQFTSDQSYPIVQLRESSQVRVGEDCYLHGFGFGLPKSKDNFTQGVVAANIHKPLTSGYNLACSNPILPGMSGGPMLDANGHLIGIIGISSTPDEQNPSKVYPFCVGVPTNLFLQTVPIVHPKLSFPPPNKNFVPTDLTWAGFILQAWHKQSNQDFAGAISDYSQAVKLNPNSVLAFGGRGIAYSKLKEFNKAILDYSQAIKLSPNNAVAYNNRGNAYLALKKYQKALDDFEESIGINPQYAKAYNNRGTVYGSLKNYKQAIDDFSKAIQLDPKLLDAYVNRGQTYAVLGNFLKAIPDYTAAISINPDDTTLIYNRGLIYSFMGKDIQAKKDFEKAAKQFQEQKNKVGYEAAIQKLKQLSK